MIKIITIYISSGGGGVPLKTKVKLEQSRDTSPTKILHTSSDQSVFHPAWTRLLWEKSSPFCSSNLFSLILLNP